MGCFCRIALTCASPARSVTRGDRFFEACRRRQAVRGKLMRQKQLFKRRVLRRRGGAALIVALGLVATMAATTSQGANAASTAKAHSDRGMFRQVNLVSDIPGMAALTDPEVKNPWGIAFGPRKTPTPLWVNNQFNPASGVPGIPAPEDLLTKITLYQ